MIARAAGVTIFLAGILVASSARAEPRSQELQLVLDLQPCVGHATGEVRDVVAVELRHVAALITKDSGDLTPDASSVATATATLRCAGATAVIQFANPTTRKTLQRTISLEDVAPAAQPHLLGLAIVELVLAGWADAGPSSPPVADVPANPTLANPIVARTLQTTDSEPPPRATTPGRRDRQLFGMVSVMGFASAPVLIGGDVRFTGRRSNRTRWSADLSIHHGVEKTSLGNVSTDTMSVRGAVLAEAAIPFVAFQAALGVRIGAAALEGSPAGRSAVGGGTVRGVWLGPSAQSTAVVGPVGRFIVGLDLETGWITLPVLARVEGRQPVAIRGWWLRGSVGVGVLL